MVTTYFTNLPSDGPQPEVRREPKDQNGEKLHHYFPQALTKI